MSVVARTGTVLHGIGTISDIGLPAPGPALPPPYGSGGEVNRRGQVFFSARLTDGRVVLLLATPEAASSG